MSHPFVPNNERSQTRLRTFVAKLQAHDYDQPVSGGWTVAALLAHMAFWDQRTLNLLRRWQAHGVGPSPLDMDAVNDALRPLCLALPPQAAADLCLAAAEAVDRELAAMDPALLAEIQKQGTPFRPDRSLHRNEHLDELEALVETNC